LILLAFILPLALYLLILGTINRRRHPLMVYGPWDFAGVLFAASGFLLFGGPGVLSVLNEHWRDTLLFGQNPASSSATESLWTWGLVFAAVYFVFVVAAASLLLWRARNYTAIYSVDLETIHIALGRAFSRLGLRPLHSGDLYYFGLNNSPPTNDHIIRAHEVQGIQAATPETPKTAAVPTALLAAGATVILEVDAFQALWHVTLRWNPVQSPLRQALEHELERELADMPTPLHALGPWLTLAACALFLLMLVIGTAVLLYRLLHHII
jgi:hypothetical protein